MSLRIIKTADYQEWFDSQDRQTQVLVEARLLRIQDDEHFGFVNRFDGITELKWKAGLRVYTAVKRPDVIVLLGGNKNGQQKDIKKAKRLLGEIDRMEAEHKKPRR